MTVWQSLTTSLPPHNNHQEIRRWQDGDSWKEEEKEEKERGRGQDVMVAH